MPIDASLDLSSNRHPVNIVLVINVFVTLTSSNQTQAKITYPERANCVSP